jgi:hypothetical protein
MLQGYRRRHTPPHPLIGNRSTQRYLTAGVFANPIKLHADSEKGEVLADNNTVG